VYIVTYLGFIINDTVSCYWLAKHSGRFHGRHFFFRGSLFTNDTKCYPEPLLDDTDFEARLTMYIQWLYECCKCKKSTRIYHQRVRNGNFYRRPKQTVPVSRRCVVHSSFPYVVLNRFPVLYSLSEKRVGGKNVSVPSFDEIYHETVYLSVFIACQIKSANVKMYLSSAYNGDFRALSSWFNNSDFFCTFQVVKFTGAIQ
jgi:hypothetical protein